jgi:peptide/nickel transport system permease protein
VLHFILQRLGRTVVTLIAITVLVFVAIRLSGDPTLSLASETPTPQEIAQIRAELGLDQPLWRQYLKFVSDTAHGEFGQSIRYQEPAFGIVASRLPATIELGLCAFLLSTITGVGLGIITALCRGRWIDITLRSIAIVGQSAPGFWLGMMLILVFSVQLGVLPSNGRGGIEHLIMPMLALGVFSIASIMRLTRSSMIETLGSDYIRFLRSKGMPEHVIVLKHALRNAFIPVLAILGIQLGHLMGGAIIVETVFNWPGLGRLMVEALTARDFPVIQAGSLILAVFMVTLNLIVDLLFGVIDPRIRNG